MIANSSKFNTSKVLLIILGVLVAIVIGFSSNAVGSSKMMKIHNSANVKIEESAKKILKKTTSNITSSVIDFFAHAKI